MAVQPDLRDSGAAVDLVEFLGSPTTVGAAQMAAALYDQQMAAAAAANQQQQTAGDPQQRQEQVVASLLAEQLAALASEQQQQQLDAAGDQGDQYHMAQSMIGPDYQLIGGAASASGPSSSAYESGPSKQESAGALAAASSNNHNQNQNGQYQNHGSGQQQQQQQRPYGLPTKSSSKEPSGMLKPLGNPKTISSPVIDFVANSVPKTSTFDKLADKLPAHQTPTVFSFASSKDPSDKAKLVGQKKRTVLRQAEQMAKLLIKSVNDKFGTNFGDQSDIPFLLSSLGPLGFAQNILLDPTLLVSLLNSAEKTYFSDVLPGPAKSALKPVLNLFRVPNKKRDKANLLNIISYLASGGQTASSVPSKHRQSFGIEKAVAASNKRSGSSKSNKKDSNDKRR